MEKNEKSRKTKEQKKWRRIEKIQTRKKTLYFSDEEEQPEFDDFVEEEFDFHFPVVKQTRKSKREFTFYLTQSKLRRIPNPEKEKKRRAFYFHLSKDKFKKKIKKKSSR